MRAIRLYRSSLRSSCRLSVFVLIAVAATLVVSLSLVSRSYARDQLQVAHDSDISTCEELAAMGVSEAECAAIQGTQAQSVYSLRQIADRIGPEAATLRASRGSLAFAAGHGLSIVGISLALLLLTMNYATERRLGTAELRDTLNAPLAVHLSRLGAVATVWLLWLIGTGIATDLFNGMVPLTLVEEYSPVDDLSGVSHILARIGVGLAGVVITGSLVLASQRNLGARPATVALGVLLVVGALYFLGAALQPAVTPTGALLAARPLGEEYTFLDHLPFSGSSASLSGPIAWLVLSGWTAGALLALGLSARRRTPDAE